MVVRASLLVVGALIVGGLFTMGPKVFASGGVGTGQNPGSGSKGTYNSDHGYGWILYNVSSTQPAGLAGMTSGSWSDVTDACRGIPTVWMFVYFNSARTVGEEYALTYNGGTNAFLFEFNPATKFKQKGTIEYYTYYKSHITNGQYYGSKYIGSASENTVHGIFDSLNNSTINPHGLTYGNDVGWFCNGTAPPPPTDYNLVPTISNVNQKIAASGSPVNVTPSVNNTGHASSSGTKWQITTFEVSPRGSIPVKAINGFAPCAYYDPRPPNGTSCVVEAGNGGVGSFAVGASQYTASSGSAFGVKSLVIGDYPVGTKVCYALSVQPYSDTSSNWSHSDPVCVVIGKQPFVQIWGGDLLGSGNITTSTTTKSGKTFGSWVEYGIFAVKNIVGTGSGAAYVGQGLAGATACNESLLSFTNAADSTGCKATSTIGNYTNSSSLPNIAASFPIVTTGANLTPTLGSNDLSDQTKSGVFTATGNLTLNGGTIGAASGQPGAGRWVVLNAPNANVTITGNITYADGPYAGIADIPQLIIIANNITIADTVTQVDAWLIAQGSTPTDGVISTCAFTSPDPNYLSFPAFPPFPDVTTQGSKKLGLSINTCNKLLTVNGPVMAQKLDLLRTAGSNPGAASGDPAEVFNLRPDAYLWSQAHSIQTGRLQTSYTTELPPRL